MEEKQRALKASSKVISIIMKIGYTAMIVLVCACALTLILMAVTGGKNFIVLPNGTNLIIADGSLDFSELVALSANLIIMGAFLFAIFMIAYRMFHGINATGDPFTEKNVKAVRVIGILVVAMNVCTGIAGMVTVLFTETEVLEKYIEAPGIIVGIIIFCMSYIIDYGCALKKHSDKTL